MSVEFAKIVLERVVFIVSDHTGLTAESMARSLLAQFDGIKIRLMRRPFITSEAEVLELLAEVERAGLETGSRPIVFSTVASRVLNQQIASSSALHFDLFGSSIDVLASEFGRDSSSRIGGYHDTSDAGSYTARIEAVEFALATDDGVGDKHYALADVILVAVSRAGKTPTCLFLGLQHGFRAANYPLAEVDFERDKLPEPLEPHRAKLFGLTIQPRRLNEIRTQRRAGSEYASLERCTFEVRRAEVLFRNHQVPFFDATHTSVEEIAANIMRTLAERRD